MEKTFTYSVLKYRSSYLLDERVNIGLLFHFIDDNKIVFLYPSSLSRLLCLQPLINRKKIKSYLTGFKAHAEKLSRRLTEFQHHNDLQREFLQEDANSLFFSDIKQGKYKEIKQTTAYYNRQYFEVFQLKKTSKRDEHFLAKQFSETLSKKIVDNQVLSLFRKEIKFTNDLGETTFDYAWQNGKTNLLKSISFDLQHKDSIQRKSYRWYGELSKLREEKLNNDYKFDLLIARPHDKNLFNYYDKALQVIGDIPGPKQLIEEAGLEGYVSNAVKTVIPLKINFEAH